MAKVVMIIIVREAVVLMLWSKAAHLRIDWAGSSSASVLPVTTLNLLLRPCPLKLLDLAKSSDPGPPKMGLSEKANPPCTLPALGLLS